MLFSKICVADRKKTYKTTQKPDKSARLRDWRILILKTCFRSRGFLLFDKIERVFGIRTMEIDVFFYLN